MGWRSKQSTAKVTPETVAIPAKRAKGGIPAASAEPAASSAAAQQQDQAAAEPVTVMLVGADGAGKSALAAALVGKAVTEKPAPTSGFQNFEGRRPGAPALTVFDVGGNAGVRSIWDDYYTEAHGLVFVVDAAAPERFEEVAELLRTTCTHEAVRGKPLLVLATKQDVPHAADAAELSEALRVHALEGAGASCMVGAGCLDAAFQIAPGAALDLAVSWLLRRIHTEGAPLRERVQRQAAEQKERERQAKEARKARLAAKRAAREKAEAEAAAQAEAEARAAEAAAASSAAPAAPVAPGTLEPLPPTAPSSPPPSPPSGSPGAFPFHSF